ncbi:MAG: ATP-dependent sacrificial sulfur transferase LarE [Thermoplasmata archaeon]|nr:ATP-dependent sacrificial sulfur transferase LarE [Thermoplasmata archaeon]
MVEGPSPVPRRWSPAELQAWIAREGRPLVALSGGVDSGAVARLAETAFPGQAVAVTLTGPAVAAREVERARSVAASIGIEHVVLPVNPLTVAEYRANPPNRCYFCRSTESAVLLEWGAANGIVQYLDGVHLDDLGDDRPGLRAMDEAKFRHPLVAGQWRKDDVRAFARESHLPNWDQPSDACLASRIPHGEAVDADVLARVEAAEAWLEGQGFHRVRVRTRGDAARIEVGADELPRLFDPTIARAVRGELRRRGFADVVLDPVGYRPRAGA